MKNSIEQFTISETEKEQLIKLKRNTGIEQWNILCRWAFCLSLAEKSVPIPCPNVKNSNVQLTWDTFGGEIADILFVALKQRCYEDNLGTDTETIKQQFRLHLYRGIGYLAGNSNLNNIEELIYLGIKD